MFPLPISLLSLLRNICKRDRFTVVTKTVKKYSARENKLRNICKRLRFNMAYQNLSCGCKKNIKNREEREVSDFVPLITARVQSTTGRLCFDTCLSINLSVHRGGGQVQLPERVRSSRQGGGSGPAAGGVGVRSSQGGSGPAARGGQVQPGGGSAKIEQHREYLLHGGRYASCIHAGGLSCFSSFFDFFLAERYNFLLLWKIITKQLF